MPKKKFLTGLIGRNIGQSRSPLMHEREADAQGLRLVYSLFDFAELHLSENDLPRVLGALELAGFAGVNVTHPYKQEIMKHVDVLTREAERVGAVNTIAFRHGQKIAYNTDVTGFAAAFRQSLHGVALNEVVQIGAGGAGSATAYALLDLGTQRLTIYDSNTQRAGALVARMARHFDPRRVAVCTDLPRSLVTSNGVVNATPMGMAAHPGMPLPGDSLRTELWVAEIVYFPLETPLLTAARETGCRTMDGSGMAVGQAARAYEIFTGYTADADRMGKTFLEC